MARKILVMRQVIEILRLKHEQHLSIREIARSCPLTPIENWLREAGGTAGYSGGFIEHYIVPIV